MHQHMHQSAQTPNLGQQLLSLHSNVAAETPLRINAALRPLMYLRGRGNAHYTTLGNILGGNHLYAGLLSCPFPPSVFVLGGFAVTFSTPPLDIIRSGSTILAERRLKVTPSL